MSEAVVRVSYSGGMDSTALAIYLRQQGHKVELVFADTGAELPETYWFIPRVARELDAKLVVVSGPTFFQKVAAYGYLLPSSMVRWCTKELKVTPLNAYAMDMAVGICADEAHRFNGSDRPLVDADITKADARKLCEQHGLVNPVYQWRSSCSCFCCPFQRKQDWKNLWREHPDLYRVAEQWEAESIATSPNGWGWTKGFRLSQLREADEAQFALFPECREEPCVICSA